MESTLRALRLGAILSALFSLHAGCCTIDLSCGSRGCSSHYGHSANCGPVFEKDPLFDGTLRHRVKGSIQSCANKVACAGGCSEIYWDESINDPATCDQCGHLGISGVGGGPASPWFVRLAKLWGTPYQASCAHGGCNDGSCLGHGSLVNHLRGHVRCNSCSHSSGLNASEFAQSDCPSCQHGLDRGHYENQIHESQIHEGGVIHHSAPESPRAPTPAKPKEIQGSESSAPANAQNRMRLHQRSGQSDPNGRLSVQLVNGHKRLVSNP